MGIPGLKEGQLRSGGVVMGNNQSLVKSRGCVKVTSKEHQGPTLGTQNFVFK